MPLDRDLVYTRIADAGISTLEINNQRSIILFGGRTRTRPGFSFFATTSDVFIWNTTLEDWIRIDKYLKQGKSSFGFALLPTKLLC